MGIYGTISESILDTVLKTKSTARELWITIEELFRDNKEARAMEYDTELRTLTIGNSTVADYCKRLKTLSNLLANIDSLVTDRQLVMYMLNGLNDKFDSIINVIKHKSPYPSFTVARSMLQLEETRLSKHVKPAPSPPSDTSTPNILYTTTDQQSSRGHHSGHQGRGHRGRGIDDVAATIITGNIKTHHRDMVNHRTSLHITHHHPSSTARHHTWLTPLFHRFNLHTTSPVHMVKLTSRKCFLTLPHLSHTSHMR
ncbi:PREDICTED: uncharacterized protein LOC104750293 [Camelina sativa]|uniref:Uncharacterized protein LOC104750293 n=1 Tax=Camelina sativa TaxID=90675 RepID=A0ABM0WFJ1_CAMSA|nr:PREDICTED: uncharacterized protein LOC104750293 [Camelina sativa]